MFDKKKVFNVRSMPDHLAPDEEKNKEEWGLKMAKLIEFEHFYRPETSGGGSCSYYDKRSKFHNLRMYARGEQDTKIYKTLLGGGDASYTNFDWRPIQVVPKFMNLIVNQMTERLFNVNAEATDNYSTDLKDRHRKSMKDFILTKPLMEEAEKAYDIKILPDDKEDYPATEDEIELYLNLKFKPAIEIASELAIKYTLSLNDYDEIQSEVIRDVTQIGIAAVKHYTDPTKGIMVEGVDPANLVHSYATNKNFKDVYYYGEVKRMTIMELKRISNGKFDDEEIKEIGNATNEWSKYHGSDSNEQSYREDDIEGMMVDILFFNFKSINTLSYKKKYNQKSKGFKMTKKESTFSKKDDSYNGFDVVKKNIDVWYEGALVLGTNKIFNYKLCENMIRPKGNLSKTIPNYIVYAPEMYQNRTKSLVERIVPYVDQMQQVHIKLQQMIAKARPNGIYIDVAGLEEIDLGEGNFLTPLEAIKIYDETGNVLGSSTNAEGEYNNGKMPIIELKNGVIAGLPILINTYNHYLNQLRDAIGIPLGTDASAPHPDMAVGVQQQLALNSNTATRHILDAVLNMSETLGEGLSLRLTDIFEYSDLKEAYINAIGKINVKTLEALKRYALHDIGIHIELKPDSEEKQYLEASIGLALSKELITLDDAIDIRSIQNIKLANELLKNKRMRREKSKREHEKNLIKQNGETQQQVAQSAAQARAQELQAKAQAELMVVEAKSNFKMKEMEKEAEVKAMLMEKEFQYNMILAGTTEQATMGKEKYREDRKDTRQDKASSNQSQLTVDKEVGNKVPRRFESSVDNITGSMELGQQAPS